MYNSKPAHPDSSGIHRVCVQPHWRPDQTWRQKKAGTVDTLMQPAPCASTRHTSDNDRETLVIVQCEGLYWSKRVVIVCTLLSARTWVTSSRLCWEIFRVSSSDKQPSQDRQALSNNWDPSGTYEWQQVNGKYCSPLSYRRHDSDWLCATCKTAH